MFRKDMQVTKGKEAFLEIVGFRVSQLIGFFGLSGLLSLRDNNWGPKRWTHLLPVRIPRGSSMIHPSNMVESRTMIISHITSSHGTRLRNPQNLSTSLISIKSPQQSTQSTQSTEQNLPSALWEVRIGGFTNSPVGLAGRLLRCQILLSPFLGRIGDKGLKKKNFVVIWNNSDNWSSDPPNTRRLLKLLCREWEIWDWWRERGPLFTPETWQLTNNVFSSLSSFLLKQSFNGTRPVGCFDHIYEVAYSACISNRFFEGSIPFTWTCKAREPACSFRTRSRAEPHVKSKETIRCSKRVRESRRGKKGGDAAGMKNLCLGVTTQIPSPDRCSERYWPHWVILSHPMTQFERISLGSFL